jgi:hypothetical protein
MAATPTRVRFGSFSADAAGCACRSMSALPAKATYLLRGNEMTRWAMSSHYRKGFGLRLRSAALVSAPILYLAALLQTSALAAETPWRIKASPKNAFPSTPSAFPRPGCMSQAPEPSPIRKSGRIYAFMTHCVEAIRKRRDLIERHLGDDFGSSGSTRDQFGLGSFPFATALRAISMSCSGKASRLTPIRLLAHCLRAVP